MYCQICKKKEATIHLTEINDGVRSEMHLCEYCAQQEGVALKGQLSINELLTNLLATQPSDEEIFGPSERTGACSNCGFTLDQFAKEPLLGCPYDYETFEKALLPLIEKAHDGKTAHCGKVPAKTSPDLKLQMELMTLRQKLDEAVRNENYELAAQLRDKINQLER
jgi:protein arginine kinase activator